MGLLILFLAIANVSAHDASGNLTVVSEEIVNYDGISLEDNIHIITNETYDDYIVDGELADDDMIYQFEGDFENLGVLSVMGNNVTVIGTDANFIDTAFAIGGQGNSLINVSMEMYVSLKDNDYSAICVSGDDTTIDNLNLWYYVPSNVEAYGIQAYGTSKNKINNFKLTNSLIYFEGHNDYKSVYNYGVFLFSTDNSLIYNNVIYGSLPLRNISWGLSPSVPSIYKDLALTVGVYDSNYLNFTNNYIHTTVNEIGYAAYPTLDSFYLDKSSNCVIENNTMYMEDFVTPKDIENYLYGLDIYGYLTNLTISNNDFTVNTTGGTYAHGTAYPIQLTGPLNNVSITDNMITSISNGPNIGIYSQNSAGSTYLTILRNIISVTGLAGTHEWALVSGIEVQDTNDEIRDNIIEVHSIDEVSEDDNLYGISYRQSTDGDHSYNVFNNTVFSEGYYAVAALEVKDSTFDSNTLYTSNDDAVGRNSLKVFDEASSTFDDNNNKVKSIWDYLADEYNTQDGGEDFVEEIPVNVNNITNNVDGSGTNPGSNNPSYNNNPLMPKNDESDNPDSSHGSSSLIPDNADGDIFGPNTPDGDILTPDVPDGDISFNTDVPDKADMDPSYVKPSINYEDYDGNNKKYTPSQNPKSNSSSSSDEVKREYENWDGNGKLANSTNINSDGESDGESDFTLKDLLSSYVTSNTKGGSSPTNSYNGHVRSNNTEDNSPSVHGDDSALGMSESSVDSSSASSAGKSGASSSEGSKAYEIVKDILKNNSTLIIPSIGLILIALFLLVVGYRRKQNEEY